MENLNKLTFKTYKINENKIYIPMSEIKQEFDINEDIKFYAFRVLYIHRYHSKTHTFTCYLQSIFDNSTIIKADIPIEIPYLHKIIGGYDYKRELSDSEIYTIKDDIFRTIDKINRKYIKCYLMCYGYYINSYKNDDANTKVESGIQEFNITSNYKKKLKDRNYESYFLYTKNIDKFLKLIVLNKSNIKVDDTNIYKLMRALKDKMVKTNIPKGFIEEK